MGPMISLPRRHLRLEDVELVSRGGKIALSVKGHRLIGKARRDISRMLGARVPVYGVNTGFGALVDSAIPVDRLRDLQLNLITSHAVGSGDALAREEVRAAVFLRTNMLSKG